MVSSFEAKKLLDSIKGKLIVSCQALENEPLFGSDTMAKMADAACRGGAAGIRANTVADILAIKEKVNLPVIGIIKREYKGSECYITPTMKEVDELFEMARPEVIAVDATCRKHPDGEDGVEFIKKIKSKYPNQLLMADVSTLDEGISAWKAGADMVSTTLSGYTSYSPAIDGPDFELMRELSSRVDIPVIGEGRIWSPEDAVKAFEQGVHAIVVGGAITRPMEITKRFVKGISGVKQF